MRCSHDNFFDDSPVEFPRIGFWLVHLIGAFAFFYMGMRFVMHRAPLSIIAFRALRRLAHKH